MNCNDFKRWMLDVNSEDPATEQSAQAHIDVCAKCEKIYRMDLTMEKHFREAMIPMSAPADLSYKIKQDLHSVPAKQKNA